MALIGAVRGATIVAVIFCICHAGLVLAQKSKKYPRSFWLRANYTCHECSPGTFANKTSSSECITKDIQKLCYNLTGECPETKDPQVDTCQPCPDLQYQNSSGKESCMFCGNGQTPNEQKTGCVDCPAGMTSDSKNHTCHLCGTGQYTPPNNHTCQFCGSGTEPVKDHSTCESCPKGKFSNVDSANPGVCEQCQGGWIPNNASDKCNACDAGQYAPDNIQCVDCQAGHTWVDGNCATPCQTGHHCVLKTRTGSESKYCAECIPCQPGTFQKSSGQNECDACPPGSAQKSYGQTACYTCPSGTTATQPRQATCMQCPAGFYCPNPKAKPQVCPEGKFCPSGSSQPQTCGKMYEADSKSCKMTIELIAIITGSCVGTMVCDGRCRSPMLGGISLLTLLVYVQYHQYSKATREERAALIATQQRADPVYNGF